MLHTAKLSLIAASKWSERDLSGTQKSMLAAIDQLKVAQTARRAYHMLKDIVHAENHQSWIISISNHGVCLAAASGAIGKDSGIQSFQHSRQHSLKRMH